MTALTTRDALAKIERMFAHYETSPIGNRCLTCGHVKHNELGYCQNGTCVCGDGTTVAGLAGIIRRDLRESVIDAATLADDEAAFDAVVAKMRSQVGSTRADRVREVFAALAAALSERGAQ